MANENELVKEFTDKKYEYGFTTDVHTEIIERGLNEEVIRLISEKKGEPDWLLEFRLKAYRYWLTLEQPDWGHVNLKFMVFAKGGRENTMNFPSTRFTSTESTTH